MTSGTHDSDPGQQAAQAISNAQQEFDTNPELRDLLARATASPTVRRLAADRAAEIDGAYTIYDDKPLDQPDEWGDLESWRNAAGTSPTVRRATERGPAPRPTVAMNDGPDAGALVQQMRAEERY